MSSLSNSTLLNEVVGSANLVRGKVIFQNYGYNVDEAAAIAFVVLFSITAAVHLVQAIRYRIWWLTYTIILGCLGEILGWSGRLWSALSISWVAEEGGYWASAYNAFLVQICCLVFSPAFITAGLYLVLGLVISSQGLLYSRLKPRAWSAIFLSADIVCILVQAAGGGLAGSASDEAGVKLGSNIMLVGIVIQLVTMLAFTVLLLEFIWRFIKDVPLAQADKYRSYHAEDLTQADHDRARTLLFALLAADIVIFTRSVFRTIELAGGWSGPVMQDQILFNIFDGMLILISLVVLNIFHPGRLIGSHRILSKKDLAQTESIDLPLAPIKSDNGSTAPTSYSQIV